MIGRILRLSDGRWHVVEGNARGEVVDDLHPALADEAFRRNVEERTDITDTEKARLIEQGFETTRTKEMRHVE